jgi:pimeloyl-ACP methyl ester carboxylesterase
MTPPTTQFLDRPDGRISYDDSGVDGPLVIAAPGMGDSRHSYRHLRDGLAEAGIRFVTMDLRGMGESTVDWSDFSDAAVASDYLALIDELGGGPATLAGNSLSCASSVIAATDAPDKVSGLLLVGPFVRDVPAPWWQKAAFGAMLSPPWGRSLWVSYYRKNMYPGAQPPDHDAYVSALSDNLREPGRFSAFRAVSRNSHAESGRRIDNVHQPVVVVMGTADPDFPDAEAEANELGEVMNAEVVMSDGSGHYPQADNPGLVLDALVKLVQIAKPSGSAE